MQGGWILYFQDKISLNNIKLASCCLLLLCSSSVLSPAVCFHSCVATERQCYLRFLFARIPLSFFVFIYLGNLCTPCGAWTHEPRDQELYLLLTEPARRSSRTILGGKINLSLTEISFSTRSVNNIHPLVSEICVPGVSCHFYKIT